MHSKQKDNNKFLQERSISEISADGSIEKIVGVFVYIVNIRKPAVIKIFSEQGCGWVDICSIPLISSPGEQGLGRQPQVMFWIS